MLGKTDLFQAIAGTNLGSLATAPQKQAILAIIAELEDRNPNPRPLEAATLLDGNWRLVYTTSTGILGIDRIPFLKLERVYQSIRLKDAKLYNIAEVTGLPLLEGIVSVAAGFKPASDRRVDVKFERSIVGLQRLIGYQSPDEFIQKIETGAKFTALDVNISDRDQQGWLDITYLDSDLRIGRGNEGSVFVLVKDRG